MNINTHEILNKEIDLIQSCITRMANNSFLLKGWLITLLAAMLFLLPENINPIPICFISLLPIIAFWYLDAFYLRQERLFRKLYDWVIIERPKGNIEHLYSLNHNRFKNDVTSIFRIMASQSQVLFYSVPVVIVVIIITMRIITN